MPILIKGSGGKKAKLQTKSTTPTKSTQTIKPDSGYDGLSQCTVDPIPSSYVSPSYTQGSKTWTPGTSNQYISSGTYCSGQQTIKGDSNLTAANIKSGVNIFGVNGTLTSRVYMITVNSDTTQYGSYNSGFSMKWEKMKMLIDGSNSTDNIPDDLKTTPPKAIAFHLFYPEDAVSATTGACISTGYYIDGVGGVLYCGKSDGGIVILQYTTPTYQIPSSGDSFDFYLPKNTNGSWFVDAQYKVYLVF